MKNKHMKTRNLLMAGLFLTVCVSLAAQPAAADPEPEEIRIPDLSAVLAPVPERGIIVRPQGNLVFVGDDNDANMRLFGDDRALPVVSPGGAAVLISAEEETIPAEVLIRERLLNLLGQHLEAKKLIADSGEVEELVVSRNGPLFVRGSPRFQDAVAEIVGPLRSRASQRFLIEAVIVARDRLETIAPDWRSKGPILDGDTVEKALLDPRTVLLSAVATAGRWTTASTHNVQALIADYSINQTGVIPVTNPDVKIPLAGDVLQVRAFPIPHSDEVWIDLVLGRFVLTPKQSPLGERWGQLDLPILGETLISLSTTLSPEKALVGGSFGGKAGAVVLLRFRENKLLEREPPRSATAGVHVKAYDVSLLHRRPVSRQWWQASDLREAEEEDFETLAEVVVSLLGGYDAMDEEGGWMEIEGTSGTLFLAARKKLHDALGKFVGDRIRGLSSVASVDFELHDLDRATFVQLRAQTEDGFLLKPGWKKSLEASSTQKKATGDRTKSRVFTLTGAAGESHALRDAQLHSLVTGVENVSGGTGFAILERSDPQVGSCGEGVELRVRTDLIPGAQTARLLLQGVDTRVRDIRKVSARYPSLPSYGDARDSKNAYGQQGELDYVKEMQFHLPRQTVRYLTVCREVPLDRDVILYSDAGQGETAKVLIGKVRRVK